MDTIQQFNETLKSFKIKASCVDSGKLDNYSFYDLKLNPNAKVRDIQKYGDELSLALKMPCKPSVKVLRERGLVRLEFVEPRKKTLNLFDLFNNEGLPKGEINCLLGRGVDGKRVWMDLAQNPHMLIAGTTGSGKSTLVHNLIANLINYNEVDIFLVDPKRIEFSEYEKSMSFINVLYTYDETLELLNNLIEVMEDRYNRVRSGEDPKTLKPMVVIIDEFADLIMQDKDDQFFIALCRLAQKCRAARIHIVLSTQRPSVNIINGSIKANFPARIACRVASHVDSKVILDTSGAENLLGKGDAFIRDNFRMMERFQVAYTTPQEVCKYFGDKNVSDSSSK